MTTLKRHTEADASIDRLEHRKPIIKPNHPLIQDNLHRDTLDRALQVLELMQNLDLSKGLDSNAQLGLFWLNQMLVDSVQYVSDALRQEDVR